MGAGVAGAVAAGGIAYARTSIYDKKHGYANNVFDKILSSKQIANYPEATQKAATTFKVISDLKECLHYNPDLFIFKTNKKAELENFYEKFKGQIEKEIEKVYNPTKKRFINENKIDSDYQKLQADIKKVSKDMKWDALKKFTLPVGLSIAFVTYHLGRLTRTYHPDIDKKQRTPKK